MTVAGSAAAFDAAERAFGAFSRSFTLPDSADVEHIQADMDHGVLTVLLPKRPEMQPRRIQVGQGQGSTSQDAVVGAKGSA